MSWSNIKWSLLLTQNNTVLFPEIRIYFVWKHNEMRHAIMGNFKYSLKNTNTLFLKLLQDSNVHAVNYHCGHFQLIWLQQYEEICCDRNCFLKLPPDYCCACPLLPLYLFSTCYNVTISENLMLWYRSCRYKTETKWLSQQHWTMSMLKSKNNTLKSVISLHQNKVRAKSGL